MSSGKTKQFERRNESLSCSSLLVLTIAAILKIMLKNFRCSDTKVNLEHLKVYEGTTTEELEKAGAFENLNSGMKKNKSRRTFWKQKRKSY